MIRWNRSGWCLNRWNLRPKGCKIANSKQQTSGIILEGYLCQVPLIVFIPKLQTLFQEGLPILMDSDNNRETMK